MGADPSQIEQEIARQRERIGERVEHLQERMQSDVDEAQSAARRQVTSGFGLDARLRRRMPLAMFGALGGGIALGLTTAGRRRRRS